MDPTPHNGPATRDRLLDAAVEVFAEKGYRDATVAEICQRADANVAAVNYYFRSKESLYVEAWRSAFEEGLRRYPPDGGVPASAGPEQRLGGRIAALMHRVMDPETRDFDILRREMGDPTGLLEQASRGVIEEVRKGTLRIVRELLGPRASLGQVLLATMTVISPVLHAVHRIRRQRIAGGAADAGQDLFPLRDADALIDHTMRFCLSGLRRMRDDIESGDWPDVELPDAFIERHKDLLEA